MSGNTRGEVRKMHKPRPLLYTRGRVAAKICPEIHVDHVAGDLSCACISTTILSRFRAIQPTIQDSQAICHEKSRGNNENAGMDNMPLSSRV